MNEPVASHIRWMQRFRLSWKVDLVVLVGILVLVVGLVALQVRDHPQLSPIDELQHFDYTLKSPSAGVRVGEMFGTEAMKAVACRGIDHHGWEAGSPYLPECGDIRPDPGLSPGHGFNTAYQHPPPYYTLTALIGEVVLLLPGDESSLVAYRLVGALWLASGLALIWYALGLVGASTAGRASVVGLLGVSPVVVHASAFVNPDAVALLGGGLLLLALLKWESGSWPWWSVAVASAAAVWLKLTNAFAVGVVVLYLSFRIWQEWDKRHLPQAKAARRERLLAASVSALLALASVLFWRFWQENRGLSEEEDLPVFADLRFDSFQWALLDDQLRAAVTPFRDQWVPGVLPRDLLVPLAGIADVGLLALLGAALAFTAARSAYRALVGGVFGAMVGIGILTMISFHLALGLHAVTPGRYGLAVLPFAAVGIAPVLRRNVLVRMLIGALACTTAAVMLYGVLFFSPKPGAPESEPVDGLLPRDELISEQEDLLNAYRCQLGVDIHLVPGGCP
ncbi:MAG: hypothetical protein OXG30_11125 [bacterium]|nr:hypothetical protein [bacterium]